MHGGVEHYYDLSVRPQRDAAGSIVGVTCAALDITEHKRVEANLSFLSTLAAALTPQASAAEVADVVTSSVVRHFGLSRCLLVSIDPSRTDRDGLSRTLAGRTEPARAVCDCRLPYRGRAPRAGGRPRGGDRRRADGAAAGGGGRASLKCSASAPCSTCRTSATGSGGSCSARCREQPRVWQPGDAELLQDVASRAYLRLERARAEERLQAAHDTFRHLVDQSPFGIYVVDADFRLVQVSTGAQKVFEQVRPLLGRDFAEVLRQLWPEPFAGQAIAIFRHTLDTGEPYHAPSTVENTPGHRRGRVLRLEDRTPDAARRPLGRRLSLLRPVGAAALRGRAA